MNLKIENKTALITGASQGIGLSIAQSLADEGCNCILIARREPELKAAIATLKGTNHKYFCIDLMQKNDHTHSMLKQIIENNNIDICIHNLGGTLGVKSALASIEEWHKVVEFNVGVAMGINNLLLPQMMKNRYGRIVHVSSISGESLRGSAPYAASKAFLNAYIKVLSREVATHNIVVSGVLPGAIYADGGHWDSNAPHNASNLPEFERKKADFLRHHHAIGRLGHADEIAPWVTFLCSEQASFATGSLIPIDGGTM